VSSKNAGFSVTKIECKESRIGKKPVTIPKGVTATLENQTLRVKGPLGELTQNYPREIKLQYDPSGIITVSRALDTRRAQQMHGLFR
jgi:large subunit ribosomal protein L6